MRVVPDTDDPPPSPPASSGRPTNKAPRAHAPAAAAWARSHRMGSGQGGYENLAGWSKPRSLEDAVMDGLDATRPQLMQSKWCVSSAAHQNSSSQGLSRVPGTHSDQLNEHVQPCNRNEASTAFPLVLFAPAHAFEASSRTAKDLDCCKG